MKLGVAIFAVLLAGCPQTPSNPPPMGDADAAPVPHDSANDDASLGARRCCANLAMLGCQKDAAGQCALRIDMMVNDTLRNPPFLVDCCASAGTKEAVRLCPGILCE